MTTGPMAATAIDLLIRDLPEELTDQQTAG